MLGLKLNHVSKRGYWCLHKIMLILPVAGEMFVALQPTKRGEFTVRCWYNALNMSWYTTQNIAIASAKHTGEIWGGYCENFWENWPRYNGTALYMQIDFYYFVHVLPCWGGLVLGCFSIIDWIDHYELPPQQTGLILRLHPANEGRRYFVTTFLIGWAQA